MDKLPADVIYNLLNFISYFELDELLPCFNLADKQKADIKKKIYNSKLTVTRTDILTAYCIEKIRHREDDLPAFILFNGDKSWYMNGEIHRENGPAIICIEGTKSWWVNGKCHREDGPAIEYSNGVKEWWVNDVYIRSEP